MSEVNDLVREYQEKVRIEKIELLRLELPKRKMVEFLIEFQQPTKQRRISARMLAKLMTHFERDWGDIESFFDEIESLRMSIDRWCTLRIEAEKMPKKKRKIWQKAFQDASDIRSQVIVKVADLVPRVRASSIGYTGPNAADLDGVGYISLIKAMENFDPTREVPFEAYARSWIYNSMIQYLRKDKLVNPSEKMLRSFRQYSRTVTQLQTELSREPDEAEIAEAMDLSTEQLGALLESETSITSLDVEVGEAADSTLHEVLGSDEAAPYQEMESRVLARSLQEHMSKLTDSELSIVFLRWFPIKESNLDGEPMTIDQAIEKMEEISLNRVLSTTLEGRKFMTGQKSKKKKKTSKPKKLSLGRGHKKMEIKSHASSRKKKTPLQAIKTQKRISLESSKSKSRASKKVAGK